jgi:hypothetical protein
MASWLGTGLKLIGTAVKDNIDEVQEGLRYLTNMDEVTSYLNRYYANMDRGSKLTRRGQMQDTDLGRLKVNVGRVPLQETGRTIIPPDDVVQPCLLILKKPWAKAQKLSQQCGIVAILAS